MFDPKAATPVLSARTERLMSEGKRTRLLRRRPGHITPVRVEESQNFFSRLQFPFLNGIKDEVLRMIFSMMVQQKYARKEYVYLPYNTTEKVYFIIHGNIEIGYLDETGRELSIDILGPGEVFGSLMGRGFGTGTNGGFREGGSGGFARSVDRCTLAVLNKNDFEEMLEKYPRFAYRILKLMSRRISTLEGKLQNLVFSDVKTRICKLLYSLYEKAGDRRNGQIKIPLTHQDIANLVASSRETASLHLSELKKSGTIDYERKWIRILSMSELQKCAA